MAGKKLTDADRLINFAMGGDIGEVTSTIRTMTLIRDNRVAIAASQPSVSATPVKTAGKKSAKKATKSPASASQGQTATASASQDGKDPERVERGRKAAETRARKKAEREAANAGAVAERQASQPQAQQATAGIVTGDNAGDEQEDLSNFRHPQPVFGPEGELLNPNG